MATKKNTKKVESKSVTPELICEVLDGKWGDEKERSAKLKAAGYAPSVVTKKIKKLQTIAIEFAPIIKELGDYVKCLPYVKTE